MYICSYIRTHVHVHMHVCSKLHEYICTVCSYYTYVHVYLCIHVCIIRMFVKLTHGMCIMCCLCLFSVRAEELHMVRDCGETEGGTGETQDHHSEEAHQRTRWVWLDLQYVDGYG